ncbi:UDP-N-acetylglucosamine 2-epimerase [Candidatus Pelagibacter sp. HIMB1321]|uniref:UDP-N-acetylglucosamine 2-epimerase n=1 Tax=Candidatus Pelagibacter sp. HIMB1321 TaxID=1388755 RepID=UPI000A080522|nr:UDP-N-acetylglucosamine 2-epimerase [Candidatus Pelagibacter sp. HIMB1321]SMF79616.1 GDP/UDP-N,N'-diacetylbacillosamine 2-epimerase (hydrolysing) [Candidatus Pelagibacter sp. HIMB1321]
MKKVLFITSTRADYALIRSVIIETQKINKNTYLLVTGSHLSKELGNTLKDIKKDKIKRLIVRKLYKEKLLNNKISDLDVSNYIAKAIKLTAQTIRSVSPQIVVLLGDRYEILGSAISAMAFRKKIVHIHGGEVTSGAMDDSIRHSISKFSHLHFPIHEKYKKRLIQLGENPKTIFNFGSLGAYSISKTKLLSKLDLEKKLKIKFDKKIILVTYHPVTLEKDQAKDQINNIIKFLKLFKNEIIIINSLNLDNEADIIVSEFRKFFKREKNVFYYASLGNTTYYSLLKIAHLVVGNSSSGVLETPSFGTKTINVGQRQKGRILSDNIINSGNNFNSIKKAYIKIIKKPKKINNLFLKKLTPYRIAKKILNFKFNIKKNFYDI